MTKPIEHIGVIGAGSFGTALAVTAARAGREVTLWARSPDLCEAMTTTRQNPDYLPDVELPANVKISARHEHLAGCDGLLIVTPAQAMRTVFTGFASIIADGTPAAICCKGIETGSNQFMAEVLCEVCPQVVPAVLSGPSFAADVARGMPTAVTLAAKDLELAKRLAKALTIPSFRVYASTDVEGVELCGAVKNVLAIACGVCQGKGFGQSARAALITRGFAELSRLAAKLEANPATLTGLSGLGDLILTCSSTQSRNFSLGAALGRGEKLEAYLASRNSVAEGVPTAGVVVELARQHGIEMPICEAVNAIVHGRSSADDEITKLLARPIRPE